jgi:hypothetical protein
MDRFVCYEWMNGIGKVTPNAFAVVMCTGEENNANAECMYGSKSHT